MTVAEVRVTVVVPVDVRFPVDAAVAPDCTPEGVAVVPDCTPAAVGNNLAEAADHNLAAVAAAVADCTASGYRIPGKQQIYRL